MNHISIDLNELVFLIFFLFLIKLDTRESSECEYVKLVNPPTLFFINTIL